MKTLFRALRVLTLLAMVAVLAACGSITTKDYGAAVVTHTQHVVASSMPTEPITAEDKNLKVTARIMQADEPNYFAKTGACYQLDVLVQNKSAHVITIVGNNESVSGKKVMATCDPRLLFNMSPGVLDLITGAITDDVERAKVMEQTVVINRVLRGTSSTQAYDYILRDRTYGAFYFSYKIGEDEFGFTIPFSPPSVSVATTTPAK